MEKIFRRILIPVDFSSYATEALWYAHSIAERFSASLLVMHVIAEDVQQGMTNYHLGRGGFPLLGPYAQPLEVPMDVMQTVVIDLREQAHTALQHCLPMPIKQHVPAPELHVIVGHPASQIVTFAKDQEADLIVMGTHGRTGFGHVFLGSVAERVVRQASCPVLTVKAPE